MYRTVYENTPGLQASVQAVVRSASCVVTPNYAGYTEVQYLEVTVPDRDKALLVSNHPASPVAQFSVPDGSGSLVCRRVQSVLVDRIKAVQLAAKSARVGAVTATKDSALTDADDLLGDLLDDLEQRPVDPGFPAEEI